MDVFSEIKKLELTVNNGGSRLCHKYRISKYYGGVATVDVVGCYLDCAYCWVPEFKRINDDIQKNLHSFDLLSPVETAKILIELATKNKLKTVRLSGGEPTLNKDHLLGTIEIVTRNGLNFVLETNGINSDEGFVEALAKYQMNTYVYYSIKGVSANHFKLLTNKSEDLWNIQLNNICLYAKYGFRVGINTMMNYITEHDFISFLNKLEQLNPYLPMCIDTKETSTFPHVFKRLKERNIISNQNCLTKSDYLLILNQYFPNLSKKRSSYLVKLGIMDFIDFQEIQKREEYYKSDIALK